MKAWVLSGGVVATLLGCEGTEGPLLLFPESAQGGAGGAAMGSGGTEGETLTPAEQRLGQVESFQIQLSGPLDLEEEADLFVLDLHSVSDEDFGTLIARGASIGCYFSAGSHEPWRPDADDFPPEAIGEPLPDYPNERWLDITHPTVVALMDARIESARSRGCTDAYPSLVRPTSADSGFALSEEAFASFAIQLAETAHARGMGALFAGGANHEEQADAYDAALVFGCGANSSCDAWASYAESTRSVFSVEWGDEDNPATSCGERVPWPQIVKNPNLDAFRHVCPPE